MLVRRGLRFLLCTGSLGSKRQTDLLTIVEKYEQEISMQTASILELEKQIKNQEEHLAVRNKQIHELRSQLTNDIKRGDQIWARTKKLKEQNMKSSVQNFARGLIELSQNLSGIKEYEKEHHNIELREGFEITHRQFFATLQKFNIKNFTPELGHKFDQHTMHAAQQIKSEDPKQVGTVTKVLENGWIAEGKIIKKAQVTVYN